MIRAYRGADAAAGDSNHCWYLAASCAQAYDQRIMATQALLLCRDPDVVGVLRPLLDELGLGPEVCSVAGSAVGLLLSRKYNPVIVDCDQDPDGELLRSLRESPANHDSIALGIIGDGAELSDAFALGANLVIRKPLDMVEAGRILRTARSLVGRMRRRFLRQVLHTLAYVHVDGVPDTPMLLDVGEGGIALQALDPLEERRAYSVRFSLPGDPEHFEAVAATVWNDNSGRAGMSFMGMTAASRTRLKRWIDLHGTGLADVSPQDVPEERVQFALQLAPAAHAACGHLFDLAIVGAAVGVFGLISWGITGESSPGGAYAVLLLGCVCGLLYRYVFFVGLSMTPGGHLAAMVGDRLLAWMYNRQRQRLSVLE